MKRLLCVLCAAFVLLAGCGGSTSTETTAAAEETTAAASEAASFIFNANGVEIAMTAPAADIIEALGEPKSYFESESCAFKGLDKEYNYGSFVVYTYPLNDADYINGVDFLDDTVATAEGISIGSTIDEVKAAYGEEPFDGTDTTYIYGLGNSKLIFIFDNDVVSSIQYVANTES